MRYGNFAETLLDEDLDASETGVNVLNGGVFPSTNFKITIDSEIMLVTDVTSNVLTVTRGYEGTTAATHNTGAEVRHAITANDLNMARRDIGTLANKPSNPVAGQWYFPTDFECALRYDGSAWQNYNENFFMTPPPTTGWSVLNADEETTTFNAQYMRLIVPDELIGIDPRGLVRSVPTQPYNFKVGLMCTACSEKGSFGIIVTDGTTTGNFAFFGFNGNFDGTRKGNFMYRAESSFVTTTEKIGGPIYRFPIFLACTVDTSGNALFHISHDGFHWIPQRGVNGPFLLDGNDFSHMGVYIRPEGNTPLTRNNTRYDWDLKVFHWEVGSSDTI